MCKTDKIHLNSIICVEFYSKVHGFLLFILITTVYSWLSTLKCTSERFIWNVNIIQCEIWLSALSLAWKSPPEMLQQMHVTGNPFVSLISVARSLSKILSWSSGISHAKPIELWKTQRKCWKWCVNDNQIENKTMPALRVLTEHEEGKWIKQNKKTHGLPKFVH